MVWTDKIEEFCALYNIPRDYLADTLYEPKVIPMIRGKAFEFTVMLALQDSLPPDEFEMRKERMNTQLGAHDLDVTVIHKPTGEILSVECKLASKGDYRCYADGRSRIRVKCMRSRTLGPEMVARQAIEWDISEELLKVHNDQYLPGDFDVVVTSIGNAFYETNSDGLFEFDPGEDGAAFLEFLSEDVAGNLQDFAFNQLYISDTFKLAVLPDNDITCTRQKCASPTECGFIPNYPEIWFAAGQRAPAPPWFDLSGAADILRQIAYAKHSNQR